MILASVILVGSVAACSICGGAAFKQFAMTREPIWIVLGVIAYNLSNIGWLALIDETGLARASVLAASAQILGLTAVAALTGERIALTGWFAAALVCFSILVSSIPSEPNQPSGTATETPDEAVPDAPRQDFPSPKQRRFK